MFKSTLNRGFQITFENKITISVQFGFGNYCSKQNKGNYGTENKYSIHDSDDAEIAIWDEKQEWYNFGHDTIKGWVSPNEVADWICKVKTATCLKDISNLK